MKTSPEVVLFIKQEMDKIIASRDWKNLPSGFENDMTKHCFERFKPYLDKRDITERITLSRENYLEDFKNTLLYFYSKSVCKGENPSLNKILEQQKISEI